MDRKEVVTWAEEHKERGNKRKSNGQRNRTKRQLTKKTNEVPSEQKKNRKENAIRLVSRLRRFQSL